MDAILTELKRTLPYSAPVVGDMTVARCITSCETTGYSMAGLEYVQECYCGNLFLMVVYQLQGASPIAA